MKTVSIIGSGWLGKPLAKHLMELEHKVNLSTRNVAKAQQLQQEGFNSYTLNLGELELVDKEFWSCDVLLINTTHKVVQDHQLLAQIAKQNNISEVIFVSSTSVYKANNQEVFEDQGLEVPEHVLTRIEQVLKDNTGSCSIVRFSGLIGGRRHPGNFFRKGGKQVKPVKDPNIPVNLIHGIDCVHILTAMIELDIRGEEFNCAAPSHPKKLEFYNHAGSQLGYEPLVSENSGSNMSKIINSDKIISTLNYQFVYPDLTAIDFAQEEKFSRLSQ